MLTSGEGGKADGPGLNWSSLSDACYRCPCLVLFSLLLVFLVLFAAWARSAEEEAWQTQPFLQLLFDRRALTGRPLA